jgi:hypothetical protein
MALNKCKGKKGCGVGRIGHSDSAGCLVVCGGGGSSRLCFRSQVVLSHLTPTPFQS